MEKFEMELSFLANKIRKVVMKNIGERKGFHFDNLDDDVLQEIKDSLEIDILKAFEVPAKDRWQRFVTAYSVIKRAERMDANDIYERSQEAAYYNWLDEENKKLETKIDKLEAEKKELVKALSYYASFLNWTIDGHSHIDESYEVNCGEFADRIRSDCDKLCDPCRGGYGGKKAREVLNRVKSEVRDGA